MLNSHFVSGGTEPNHAAERSVDELAVQDLTRNVYGLLGIPVDAIDFSALAKCIDDAVDARKSFFISTPNVNFLVKSLHDERFRESVLQSELSLPDGMPLIWISKLLRIPIKERIAGSDLFGRLKNPGRRRKLRVFLLGGAEGISEIVSAKLNSKRGGLECVGFMNPGFGNIEQMSTVETLDTINASQADLLAVFFGAEKAQAWLMQNRTTVNIPVRAQFGATINFEAGVVKRAPSFIRSTGFEWLWRIKEEPFLWRRYWNDGKSLACLLVTSIVPLMALARRPRTSRFSIEIIQGQSCAILRLTGPAIARHASLAICVFLQALKSEKPITLDLAKTEYVDPRFFGLFLMLRKQLVRRGQGLKFEGVTPQHRRLFQLNRFDYLLE